MNKIKVWSIGVLVGLSGILLVRERLELGDARAFSAYQNKVLQGQIDENRRLQDQLAVGA